MEQDQTPTAMDPTAVPAIPGKKLTTTGLAIVFGCELASVAFWFAFDFSENASSAHVYDGLAYFYIVLYLLAGAIVGSLILAAGLVLRYRANHFPVKLALLTAVAMTPIAASIGFLAYLFFGTTG